MRNEVDIFDLNFFADDRNRKELPYFYENYAFALVSGIWGWWIFSESYEQLFRGRYIVSILATLVIIFWGIYVPSQFYIKQQFYSRLIVFVSINDCKLDVVLYNKKNIKIHNYEILSDWKPYFMTFNSIFRKMYDFKNHSLYKMENTHYYTIKDLDTGILYLFCVNKEQYLNALQEQKLRELSENE